jgi:hypothetical protein
MLWAKGKTGPTTRLVLHRTGWIISKVTRARALFALFFSMFCAVHWLVVQNFSIYLVPVAILFGAIATVLTVWLSGSPFSPSSEQQ